MQKIPVTDTEMEVSDLVRDMKGISLEEMSSVKLMNRRDIKFLLPLASLPVILRSISDHYCVQIAAGKRMASYETIYYDSCGLEFFLEHVNGRLNRRKVRRRTYLDSDLHFLEVKRKTNKDKTIKTRVAVTDEPEKHGREAIELVKVRAGSDLLSLFPRLVNRFIRVTLVNPALTERVTVDFHLSFGKFGEGEAFPRYDLAIIEVKQDKSFRSFIMEALRDFRIKKSGFSKYCFGMVLTGQVQKTNNMKRKLRRIQKIIYHEYVA